MNGNFATRSFIRTTLTVAGLGVLSLPAFAAVVSQSTPAAGAAVTQRTGTATHVLPPALRAVFYKSLAKNAGAAYNVNAKGCATLPGAKLTACFDGSGAHFTGAGALSLHLTGYGRGDALSLVKAVRPTIEANQVSYTHSNLAEWWRVLPVGFEQGFTLNKRPTGHGELTLALTASRQNACLCVSARRQAGAPTEAGHQDTLTWGKLRYGKLVVTDAKGKVVPATLTAKGDQVLIAVNDAHAAYPLTVDPLVWIEQKVTASDGMANDQFGYVVAIQGTTALVASPYATVNGISGAGAVYVFNESNGVWSQTQKLTPSDEASIGFAEFGSAMALNGTTALIAASLATVHENIWQGAAYFFTESNGTWTQTQEVTASDGTQYGTFGVGDALGDGVAFISAGGASVNGVPVPSSAYVFTESNGTWTQTQELPSPNPAGDEFGYGATVGISGTTAVVGAYAATVGQNQYEGNATVFTESGGTWTQTQILTGSDSTADNFFGTGVAIQGNTILIGAEYAKGTGTAYVFTNSGGTWTQAQELAANDGLSGDAFGSFTALDGATALVGAVGYNSLEGKAYVFTNSNGTWSQTQELIPSDNPTEAIFGFSGSLSMPTALIGAHGVTVNGNSFQGAAYLYGESDLGLNVSAPQSVGQGQQYTSQTIATNNASATSPAVSATVTVPAAASFISATATQGSCSEASGVVTCDFGPIGANAGTATANVTLKATGSSGTTINNTASVALATPALTASAPTQITGSQSCPAGYTTYTGTLAANKGTRSPSYEAPAGVENAILYAPAGFKLYARVDGSEWGSQRQQGFSGTEVHRWGPAGIYAWGVKAGETGGAYTFCLLHP